MAVETAGIAKCNLNRPDSKCPECGSNIITDPITWETYCSKCGLVINENPIDLGPEWRAYTLEQHRKRARTGPFSYPGEKLGTSIKPDFNITTYKLRRVQKITLREKGSKKSLVLAFSEIKRMINLLGLQKNKDIQERAERLYKKLRNKGKIPGKSIESVVAAVLYRTCKESGIPRTFEEIAVVSRVSKGKIIRAHSFLVKELNLKPLVSDPVQYIPRFCSLLELGTEVRQKAIEIANEAREKGITNGKNPLGVAGAAISIAADMHNKHKTNKEIAKVADTTETTIHNREKEIQAWLLFFNF